MDAPDRTRAPSPPPSPLTRISQLAHDIANVFVSMTARLSVLATRQLPEEVKRELEGVLREADRARDLIRELSRASHSGVKQKLSLLDGVKRAIAASGLEREGTKVELACLAGDAEALVNPEQLELLLESIFAAELESRKRTTPDLRVEVRIAREKDCLLLTARSNSPEIPEADLSRFLNPFFLKQGAGFGSGIPFGICAQIARDHDGRFSIGRGPNGGREYRLELPVLDIHRFPGRPASPPERPVPPVSARGHLLVIDDDARVLESFEIMVSHLGYTMDSARSGEEALRRLGEKSFDAVILDFHLSGSVDGADVLHAIQRTRPEILPRTLLATGDSDSARLRALASTLCVRVLAKPFGVQELLEAIESLAAR